MQAIIFTGIQATGKTSFYAAHFLKTHVRISLDLLRTRNRERIFMEACLKTKQRFVVDNTNPTIEDRKKYISLAKQFNFEVIGYFFESSIQDALQRNQARQGRELIPDKGLWGTHKRLQVPSLEEGYDLLYAVSLREGHFLIKDWQNEI